MPDPFITVRHPEIEGVAQVTEDVFDLDLSAKGWTKVDGSLTGQPAKSASAADWQAYARGAGMPPERAAEMSRDELVAIYTSPVPDPAPTDSVPPVLAPDQTQES